MNNSKKAFAIGNAMHPACGSLFIYASNEPKSVLARDLGDCRVNERQRVWERATSQSPCLHETLATAALTSISECRSEQRAKARACTDLGDCRVNLKNTLCKFLIVLQEIVFLLNKKPYARKSAAIYKTDIVRTAADALTGKRAAK